MGQHDIIETLSKFVAGIGAIVAVGYLLRMLSVFIEGLQVAQNGGSVVEITPYITALVILLVLASIPMYLDVDLSI